MKPFFRRPIFICTTVSFFPNLYYKTNHRTLLHVSHFSTSSSNLFQSSHNTSYPSRRQEEESRNVRVSVWWDFENCTLPGGANVLKVSQSITAAIRANGIKGPIQITAFGDVMQLSRGNQEALSSTGINLCHIPHGGKNSADRSLLVDLMYWVTQNPPPAHLFLISGDRDFAGTLHRLRMNNYNILLASPESAPSVLCSAASVMWQWNSLVKGENLSGKYFNQPPDGPYNSWYGHYRAPLEDPFAITEPPACLRSEELSDSGSDPKFRPIPRAVIKQIRHILNSCPKGMTISDLRSQLIRGYTGLDKDLYGYKKFSRFLLAMPQILKLESGAEGQLVACSLNPKIVEQVESSPGAVNNKGETNLIAAPNSNVEFRSSSRSGEGKSSLPTQSDPSVKASPVKLTESTKKVQEEPAAKVKGPSPTKLVGPSPLAEVIENVKAPEVDVHPAEQNDTRSEVGFVRRIWRNLFEGKHGGSAQKSCSKDEKCCSQTKEIDGKSVKSENQLAESSSPGSLSSANIVALANTGESCGPNNEKPREGPGFLNQIMNWCKFWKQQDSADSGKQLAEDVSKKAADPWKHEIFSKESFWVDMEAFLDTPQGSDVVFQSRNRTQMAKGLQKQGPLTLRSLDEGDLLHLVELLIWEMKWVAENSSLSRPFSIIPPIGKKWSVNSYGSNGLRSISLGTTLQSDSQKSQEQDVERRNHNITHDQKKSSGKSRTDILSDCQKLVEEIVKEYPVGFNMGSFRKLFLDRYGYHLDIQKLGYQKLATLIQIMPGATVECNYIVPCPKSSNNSSTGTVDCTVRKSDDSDTQWDELGPVSKTKETDSGLSEKTKKEVVAQTHHDYKAVLDDDFLSESEAEESSGLEGQRKPEKNDDDDSSLLQILDSWYSSKEDKNKRDSSDGAVDVIRRGLRQPSASGLSSGRKQRHSMSYSFVSGQNVDGKDKLIDGIMGSLKKSGEKSVEPRI